MNDQKRGSGSGSSTGDRPANDEAEAFVSALRARQRQAPIEPEPPPPPPPASRRAFPAIAIGVGLALLIFANSRRPDPVDPGSPDPSVVEPVPESASATPAPPDATERDFMVSALHAGFFMWLTQVAELARPPAERMEASGLPVDRGPALHYGWGGRGPVDLLEMVRLSEAGKPIEAADFYLELRTLLTSREGVRGALAALLAGAPAVAQERLAASRQSGAIDPREPLLAAWSQPFPAPGASPTVALRQALAELPPGPEAEVTRALLAALPLRAPENTAALRPLAKRMTEPRWRYFVAGLLRRLGDGAGEWAILQQLVKDRESSAPAHYRIAEILRTRGSPPELLENLEKARDLAAGDQRLMERTSMLRLLVETPDAKLSEKAGSWAGLRFEDRQALGLDWSAGVGMLRASKPVEALAHLETALALHGLQERLLVDTMVSLQRSSKPEETQHFLGLILAMPLKLSPEVQSMLLKMVVPVEVSPDGSTGVEDF